MKYILSFMALWLVACQSANSYEDKTLALVPLKTFPLPKISARAMQLLSDKNVAFAGSDASFGFINTQNHTIALSNLKNKGVISDFRSVAATSDRFFMLSIGTPALLYRAEPSGMTEVFRDDHPLAFYDSMHFLNDQFGIAVGDPIDSRMQVLVTHNGGKTWAKRTWSQPPKLAEGEAVFAASNSAIAHIDKKLWVVTGGSASRIFSSEDQAHSWTEIPLPLAQGAPTKGAFSVAFYDSKHGIVMGGNYEQPSDRNGTGAITDDGGKTWQPLTTDNSFGYVSCVKYVPNSKGYALVACSPNGLYYSTDRGYHWQRLSVEVYHALLFIDEQTLIASGDEKISIFRVISD